MNEISFQNSIANVSGVKDDIQSKSAKKEGSTFKGILEKVSSNTSSVVKKNSDDLRNAVNENKVDGTKVIYDKKDNVTNSDETEAINDNKDSIELSSKELAELKAVLSKLQISCDSKGSTDDKSKLNLDQVIQIVKANLVKINDALKNKNLSIAIGDKEIQQSQVNVDLINELNEMKNQIESLLSEIDTANTAIGTQSGKKLEDMLNADLSEHSTNAEKNETNDSNTKASDNVLALCGMASILSEIAALKAEEFQNPDNSTKVLEKKSLTEIQSLNKGIANIKDLIKSSNQISPENQKDYEELGAAALKVISNANLGVKIGQSDANDKLSISTLSNAKEAANEIVNLMSNGKEDIEVDSNLEKLINKFIGQADKLAQRMNGINDKNEEKTLNSAAQINNQLVNKSTFNISKNITNDVRRKFEDGDIVFDRNQNKFVIFENKADTSFKKALDCPEQHISSKESIDKNTVNKEDGVLIKLTSEDKDSNKDDVSSKIARVTNLAASLQTDKSLPLESIKEVPVVNRQTFNEDLVKSLKYMELNNVKELTVKVAPKELGELFIKITREGEVVKAQITATNRDAYNALNSNLTDITNKLSEQNIKIHSFNVEIYNGDSSFLNQGSKNENGNSQGRRKNGFGNLEVEEVGNPEEITYDLNNLNALA